MPKFPDNRPEPTHSHVTADGWFTRGVNSKIVMALAAVALLVGGMVLGASLKQGSPTALDTSGDLGNASTFLQCHDNTTAALHNGHWTHGDPNTGVPGDPNGGNGYYYLSITACGPLVYGEVYSPDPRQSDASTFAWDMDISPGYDHTNELAATQVTGAGGRVYITNATAGAQYRLRVANISTSTHKDYAEFNSGPVGGTDADCGGPGPVRDPNTGGAPVEPAPTVGMPANSCAKGSGTVPFPGGPTPPSATPTPAPPATPTPAPSGSSSSSSSQSSSSSSVSSSSSSQSSSFSSSSASSETCTDLSNGTETCVP